MSWLALAPITLSGETVSLAPLSAGHHDDLVAATRDGDLSRLWYTNVVSPDGMAAEAGEWPAVRTGLTYELSRSRLREERCVPPAADG